MGAGEPGLRSTLDEGFDRVPGHGNQEDQAGDVGQQSGSDQDDSRDQDEKTIEKLFGRHRSLLKFPLDAVKNPQSLKSSQVCAYDAGPEDQQQGRQGPQTTSDFDQKSELDKGNHDKHRQ